MDYEFLDEDSFDLCNDEELSLSQSPSASASVCSEAMFEELNANPLMLSNASTSIAADPEPEKPLERRDSIASLHEEPTKQQKQSSQEQKVPKSDADDQNNSSYPSTSTGSRISNKKRRKQIKRQKRAAAAAAAAEALIAQHSITSTTGASTLGKNKKGKNSRSTTTPNPKAPVAVHCAHQSLAEYRNEMKERNGVVGAV